MADKHLSALKWTATACALIGATLVALNLPISGWGFVLFLGSSLGWLSAALITGDRAQAAMQMGFTAVNVLGIVRWLF